MFNPKEKIPDNILADIYEYAEKKYPDECCGVLVSAGGVTSFIGCTNISDYPQSTFAISPKEYADVEDQGEIQAIVHSHVLSSSKPSVADTVSCNQTGLPWLIVSVPNRSETLFLPNNEIMPYEGRPFFHQLLDCWSLVVDYYGRELGIEVPNFQRQDNWWIKGQNLYLDLAEEAGFNIILNEKPQVNDVLIMQVGAEVPNHGAIYLGNKIILHHMSGRPSCKAVYGGFWEKNTWGFLRHKSLM